MTIKGNNKYNFEGTETGKTWTFHVKDNNNLVTEHIAAKLKDFNQPIYFSDITAEHWIFDFQIDGVWFEALAIDCNRMEMALNAYQ